MGKMLFGLPAYLSRQIRRIRAAILFHRHRTSLQPLAWQNTSEYTHYLDAQLHRTLLRQVAAFRGHARPLIDKTAELINLTDCDILCVGCRDMTEINYFRDRGAKSVVGIDLFSQHEDILIMDMHQMDFPNGRFDVVHSSHSLEHAYDAPRAIKEIVRVCRREGLIAIEVPVRYQTGEADLIDFGGEAGLRDAFEQHAKVTTLWSEELEALSASNPHGNPVVRIIFLLPPS